MELQRLKQSSNIAIPQDRLDDFYTLFFNSSKLHLYSEDIISLNKQDGGLFNYLLCAKTKHGTFFYKQYLDNSANEIYDLPNIPATERALLAYEVQNIAFNSCRLYPETVIPEILGYDSVRSAFLMKEAAGDRCLISHLSTGDIPHIVIEELPKMLAGFHQSTYNRYSTDTLFANTKFRNFKLTLQYDDITQRLNAEETEVVLACREKYQKSTFCVTHGDINSRNILVTNEKIGVIDFEQSHLGTPAYDLAYILSEIFISLKSFDNTLPASVVIGRFLENYFRHFQKLNRKSVEDELAVHLAIQVLYRFWGPSRKSWTFYVDEANKDRIIQHCRKFLISKGSLMDFLN